MSAPGINDGSKRTWEQLRDEKLPLLEQRLNEMRGACFNTAEHYRRINVWAQGAGIVVSALATSIAGLSASSGIGAFKYIILALTFTMTVLTAFSSMLRLPEIPQAANETGEKLTALLYSLRLKSMQISDERSWRQLEYDVRMEARALWGVLGEKRYSVSVRSPVAK